MMRAYADRHGCRRAFILGYFGEAYEPPCGNCDNCDKGLSAAEDEPSGGLAVGARVAHDEWGEGTVGQLEHGQITVVFDEVGYKTLDAALVRRARPALSHLPVTPKAVLRRGRLGCVMTNHVLVIANETVEGHALVEAVRHRALSRDAAVLVVAPALNTRLRHLMSDSDGAYAAAEQRLDGCLGRLTAAGLRADGYVGDADPVRAIEDALNTFPADEIVIGTHPEQRSNWLAHNLVRRARVRFRMPVFHVVVDLAAQREYVAA